MSRIGSIAEKAKEGERQEQEKQSTKRSKIITISSSSFYAA